MNRFAELLDRLVLTPSRNGKLTLLVDYFRSAEDPDRGWRWRRSPAISTIAAVKPAMLRALVAERMDPVLFGYSYDYVGDLAETVSLVWPRPPSARRRTTSRRSARWSRSCRRPAAPTGRRCWPRLLDSAGISARFALIKLVTGGLRIGVSARLAKQALADFGKVDVAEIEELWHGLTPPYAGLFAWLEGKAPKAAKGGGGAVPAGHAGQRGRGRRSRKARPGRLCRRMEMGRHPRPGCRARAACAGSIRAPATTSPAPFPTSSRRMDFDAALDGELLVGDRRDGTGTFSDLQQRLNRKTVSPKMREHIPAFMRGYDLLQHRRRGPARPALRASAAQRLEAFVGTLDPTRFDLSPLVAFADWEELDALRADAAASGHRRRDAEAAGTRPISPAGRRAPGSSGSATRTWSTRC